MDVALGSRAQLFVQFFRQSTPSVQPGLFPLSGLSYENESTLAMLQHTWSLRPTMVNSLRFGFLRNAAVGSNQGQSLGPILDQIGVANTFGRNGSAMSLQGYSSFGRSIGEVGNRDNTWQLDEEFTQNRAGHGLSFGAGLRYRRGWHLNGNAAALGSLTFQPVFTAQLAANSQGQRAPVAGTGDSFADFLLGYPTNGMLAGLPVVQFRATQVTPFFQDTWRVTRGLTSITGRPGFSRRRRRPRLGRGTWYTPSILIRDWSPIPAWGRSVPESCSPTGTTLRPDSAWPGSRASAKAP